MQVELRGVVSHIGKGFIKLIPLCDYYKSPEPDFTKKWLKQYFKRNVMFYFTVGIAKCKFLNADGIDIEAGTLMNAPVVVRKLWFYQYGEPKRKAIGSREIQITVT